MNHDPIFSIVDRANELRAAGADVIDLAAGEPGGPTPPQSALRSITGCHSRSEACAVPYARRDRLEAGLFVSIPGRADARPLQ
jgi:aspartate/methionine/tyrosine aminotransferase